VSDENTNLTVLQRSRKKVGAGDVFTFQLLDGPFRFGRVVATGLNAPMPDSTLVYIYRAEASDPADPPLAQLVPEDLLIPPVFTNRQGWLRGYFKTLLHQPIEPTDLLATHCFFDSGRKIYRNEQGEPLSAASDPCGSWSMASHRGVDDRVSQALGLPLAPD
jgi:hypothetical protein